MLRGRQAEQDTITALLGRARDGISGALVVRGEPGIGKTSLLDHAAAQAGDLRVLRGTGIESEAELPFAGLHLLLRPVLDRLDALPELQRRALAGAFGLGESGDGDRFLIGAGVLTLLAEQGPLLCLVDDAQWLDRASADALLFAARRLDREGVVLVFAARDYADAFVAPGLPELRLTGLDDQSASALLDDTGIELPAELRARLVAETRGNPLALRELPAVVSAHDTGPMPLTTRVLDAFWHQVRSLPAPSRTLLLLAAADQTGELKTLLRAANELGAALTDLEPAEERGLVSLVAGTLTFRHPLIRAAVYHGAAASSRIAVHSALAAEHHDPDLRAWHLAAAATGPDEGVAAELERAAGRAITRGGHAAAATMYERAARLSQQPEESARRLLLACEAATRAGRLDWANSLAETLPPDLAPDLRVRLIQVRASADFAKGDLHHAHRLLVDGAALADDPVEAFWMLVRALHAAWAAPTDVRLLAEPLDRFDEVGLAPDDPLMSMAWLARWGTAMVLDRDTAAFPPLDEVLAKARSAAAGMGPRGMTEVASRALVAARDEESAEIATELIADARAHGVIVALPAALGHLTLVQTVLGRHREARVTGAEGMRIAADTGQPLWAGYTAGALAYLAAIEGDEPGCRHYAELTADDAASSGDTWAQTALALLDLGQGRVQKAFDRLRAVTSGPSRHLSGVVRCVPDHVEAAVRLGRPQDAAGSLELFANWAATMDRPWIHALLARCRALTTPEAEPHFVRALDLHPSDSRPFDRARTELLYGEWLRRARRKSKARDHLSAALKVFEELGSGPWAARARAELGATGAGVTPKPASGAQAELTPQELQITQLAAQGLSNRDIAAQLYLSPRTVAYHLYKAYPKLGVTSRGELAEAGG
ncbi:helix-turn-helix transcriptional regulator [Amycolatopsis magusensis]|uniref:helix-turn-helix transcriptional regulator n=1 Tax=Amycolatopsis magusensis TaxID=882444 RepID=UPI0024A9346A|nr:helix-turn-helix transcriptional regulator [Amycolatopsis magusensis]MDI5978262.1 AAA family ATPase [Amycolatopsis magusensis]